jgi:hypothetical protein
MSENEQQSVMTAELVLSSVEVPRVSVEREATIEDDVKRAWRRGWTTKHIMKRYGGTPKWVAEVVKYTKRKCDINKNNIMIIQDYNKKDKDGRPIKKTFYPKKD